MNQYSWFSFENLYLPLKLASENTFQSYLFSSYNQLKTILVALLAKIQSYINSPHTFSVHSSPHCLLHFAIIYLPLHTKCFLLLILQLHLLVGRKRAIWKIQSMTTFTTHKK